MKYKEKWIVKSTLLLSLIFVAIYVIYPSFISTEKANEWNVKKFDRAKPILENFILECQNIYVEKYKNKQSIEFSSSTLPGKTIEPLLKKGLFLDFIVMSNNNGITEINASFNVDESWNTRYLNNVSLEYHSRDKEKERKKPKSLANPVYYYLGDGWMFYIDTDWY